MLETLRTVAYTFQWVAITKQAQLKRRLLTYNQCFRVLISNCNLLSVDFCIRMSGGKKSWAEVFSFAFEGLLGDQFCFNWVEVSSLPSQMNCCYLESDNRFELKSWSQSTGNIIAQRYSSSRRKFCAMPSVFLKLFLDWWLNRFIQLRHTGFENSLPVCESVAWQKCHWQVLFFSWKKPRPLEVLQIYLVSPNVPIFEIYQKC